MSTPSLLHIFRAGTYQAMAGQSITLTPADLAATAAAYDPARHEAPLVVGHPVDNGPAWGWVSGLSADGADLSATPRDVAAEFAEAVGELLRNPELRQRLARNGRQLVQARFSWERAAERFVELCGDVVMSQRGQGV